MIFNYGSGNVAAGSWKFKALTAKPEAVAKNTMIGIVTTLPTNITVADEQPANPAANDVWFHIVNPEDSKVFSDGSVPIRCFGAYQYVSGAWTLLTAYYSYLGVWWELPGLPSVGTTLANCTWAQIDRIGAAGKAADYFCVGDEKSVTLTTSEVITLQIIGFAHDNLSAAGGGKAPITFCMKDCLNAKQQLNATNTSAGGYSGCALYPTINGSLYGSLPEDLRMVIKNVNKLTSAGSRSATIVTTAENVFLLSEVEVSGATANSQTGEGTQYAFYTSGSSRIKRVSGVASYWWLRSPCSSDTAHFAMTYTDGSASHDLAYNLNGIALALCV